MSSMLENEDDKPLGRLRILEVFVAAVFILFAVRLFNMQVISREQYQRRSWINARRTDVIPARRGEIFDRNFKEPLVTNGETFVVKFTPAEAPKEKIHDVLTEAASILNINRDELLRKFPLNRRTYDSYNAQEIAKNISFETIAALSENADSLPGISWQSRPVRNYGNLGSLSHIIGYVGNITREEITQLYNEGYKQDDTIGKTGIESEYDRILRGQDGSETRTVDAKGRRISAVTDRKPAVMGKNLVLTVDRRIQALAEKALGERKGAVVVMKPSGEILALVSYPWYDSNIFNKTNFAADYARLIENPDKPFMNRTIQAYYPPASTFKILMTTGLLAENLVNPSHRILCSGSMVYGGETRRCWARGGHGMLNLQQGLANSCDIYFWVTGRDNMGVERIVKYAQEFGYGKKTGIDIPGEISGFVPTPQWKERRDHERWFPGDTMNISIGQGALQVTPLQVSNLVATVVNDGVGYRPHILKEVRDSGTGALERTVVPEIINDLRGMVPPETFLTVRYDMRSVVTEGTAKIANIAAVQIAGKTGTAEFGNNGDNGPWHHWFAAYGPFNTTNRDEQVIVTVLRDDGYNETNWSAAYAATLIFQGIFANQTYEEAVVGRRYVQTALRGRQD